MNCTPKVRQKITFGGAVFYEEIFEGRKASSGASS
jgi:hypothetical protein